MDRHNRTTQKIPYCTVCPSPQTEDRLSYTLHAKRDDSRKAQKPPYRPVASAQILRITPANVRYLCIDVCLWNRLFHRPKVRLTHSLSQGTVTPVLCALGATQFCPKFPHFVCVLDRAWAIPHLLLSRQNENSALSARISTCSDTQKRTPFLEYPLRHILTAFTVVVHKGKLYAVISAGSNNCRSRSS